MDMDVDNAGETKLLTYILAKVYLPYYTLQNVWNIIQRYRDSTLRNRNVMIETFGTCQCPKVTLS